MSERRNQERFTVDEGIFIYNTSPAASFVGRIVDISRTGVAFSYVTGVHVVNDIDELGILVPNVGIFLKNLPFKTISDEIIQDNPTGFVTMRRRSGHFLPLTPQQEDALEWFIKKFTGESNVYAIT